MAKKKRCPACQQPVEVRKLEWGWIYKDHDVTVGGQTFECPESGKLVK